jgi:hypothetical protein
MITVEKASYLGVADCLRLTNGTVDVVVATAFGPRVLHYGLTGGDNVLGWCPERVTATRWGPWRPRGGHRLWAAPEAMPRSYAADDEPVEFTVEGDTVRLRQRTDRAGIRKEVSVTVGAAGSGVTLRHTIANEGLWPIEAAPWALTIVRGGGTAIIPQEPWASHDDALDAARALVLWPYTDMADPRFTWASRYVFLRDDPARSAPQKVGASNRLGWCAYHAGHTLFVKRFAHRRGVTYPDFGCSCEVSVAGGFAEVETLGPLQRLEPGEASAEHVERWVLVPDVALPAGAHEGALRAVNDVLRLDGEPAA